MDYSAAAQAAADGQPVQFERDAPEADPFGLDQFLTDVSSTVSAGDTGNVLASAGMPHPCCLHADGVETSLRPRPSVRLYCVDVA